MPLSFKLHTEAGETYWRIVSYCLLILLLLQVSTALTFTNTFSSCPYDFHVGRTNLGTFRVALTSHCSGFSGSSMPLSRSIWDSMSAAQSPSLSFGWSWWSFLFSQFSVSEMLSGMLSSSLATGWGSILLIRWTCNAWVHPPGMSCADKTGGKGHLSENLNAATQSCWKSDQNALILSSVSEVYPIAVICLFRAQDSFWVACRFWLPCHISNKSWALAILCKFLSSASLYISGSGSLIVGSSAESSPPKIPIWARAHCLPITFSQRLLPSLLDCLQSISSCHREQPESAPKPSGMIEDLSPTTLQPSAHFECLSSCCSHQSVISGIENVLLISIGSEW